MLQLNYTYALHSGTSSYYLHSLSWQPSFDNEISSHERGGGIEQYKIGVVTDTGGTRPCIECPPVSGTTTTIYRSHNVLVGK